MRVLQTLVAAASAIAVVVATSPARATDWSYFRHAPDSDVLPVSWAGFIVNPEIGYRKLKLDGLGAPVIQNPDGFVLGGELGYDFQLPGVVIGVVGNVVGAWLDGKQEKGLATTFKAEVDTIGMIRGKIGVPIGRWLVFGTAGGAFTRLKIENQTLGISDSETMSGWAAGGGLEYRYNKRMTLRAEYIRADFGSATFQSLPVGQQTVDGTMDIVKFGLTTRF